jgi:hypothetical protein
MSNLNILQPQTEFEVKLKNKDLTTLSDEEFLKIVNECADKTVCLYFCHITENLLQKMIDSCKFCTYLNTSLDIDNIKLVHKFSNNQKISCFLTHMTYAQYGEMVHPLKMMMEKLKEDENKVEVVKE